MSLFLDSDALKLWEWAVGVGRVLAIKTLHVGDALCLPTRQNIQHDVAGPVNSHCVDGNAIVNLCFK